MRILLIILISLITVAFTAIWLGIYHVLNVLIWSNNYVLSHRFLVPILVLIFSLLIGICQKYLRAPNMIHGGGLVEALTGGGKTNVSTFPAAIIVSYLSLLSGASIGPEGSIGLLVTDIVEWVKQKFRITNQLFPKFLSVGIASAYNGIIGSPMFTGLLVTEIQEGGNLSTVSWNLLGGVIGFTFFTILQLQVFAKYIPFNPINSLKFTYFVWAFLLGIVGVGVAVLVKISFQFFEKLLDRFFKKSSMLRILFTGLIIAIVGYFLPEVMFAGETQIFPMISHPASYGIFLLLLMGILKILLMALSFKSGYIGGPTFPILFSCTMIGLALSLLFPGIPVTIFVLCIEVSTITLALNAPLTAIFLVAIIGTANENMLSLLVVSAVVAMGAGEIIKQRQVKQKAI